jgi:hypothetical protein
MPDSKANTALQISQHSKGIKVHRCSKLIKISLPKPVGIINFVALIEAKNQMKYIKGLILIAGLMLVISCMGPTMEDEDNAEEHKETAINGRQENGELLDPMIAARTEARKFLAKEWKDSLQLQNQVLEAKAAQSRYVLAGRQKDAAIFDSVFISTLRTINPDLAFQIER